IGHMGRSSRAEEIFAILKRHAKSDGSVARAALIGLRWFNTHPGWDLVREHAAEVGRPYRETATELLGYDDEPATRDLLLRMLSGNCDTPDLDTALTSARRLWGKDALEPDYALLSNDEPDSVDDLDAIVERVRTRGEPGRIFEILPRCQEEFRKLLASVLVNRKELPIVEAKAALASPDPTSAGVAARVLGRAGKRVPEVAIPLESTLAEWRRIWSEKRKSLEDDRRQGETRLQELRECLRNLVWAAGRIGIATSTLIDMAKDGSNDPAFQPIRLEAVLALAEGEPNAEALKALEAAATTGSP
ncbi:hypothetical protein ACYOEI_39610, partial [Singulisphaera rosea]